MKQLYKDVYRILSVCLILGICCNLWLGLSPILRNDFFPTIFGYSVLQVSSGSMAPAIHTGDAIIIHKEDSYEEGDIITFYQENLYLTHRIMQKQTDYMITKGDANNAADPRNVSDDEIYGKVVLVIPKGGILLNALHNPVLITGTALTAACFWLTFRTLKKQKRGESG